MTPRPPGGRKPRPSPHEPAGVRIIGGRFRGRKILYSGDPRTRPMKDRVREAVFNLLGTAVRGKHALDLFAGTGALGLEALSRGAAAGDLHRATSSHGQDPRPHGRQPRRRSRNGDRRRQHLPLVPPPAGVAARPLAGLLLAALRLLRGSRRGNAGLDRRPDGSRPAGEPLRGGMRRRFDLPQLPEPEAWDVRGYPPAVVAIYEKRGKAEGGRRKETGGLSRFSGSDA